MVVLNPDLPVAYRDLLPAAPPAPAHLLAVLRGAARRLDGRRYAKIAHHNIHFGRAWKGTFDEVIRRGELMTDPSLLVTNPSRTDPSVAPAGRHTYYVLAPVPNLDRAPFDWRGDLTRRYADQLIGTLEERGYVGFGDGIEVLRVDHPGRVGGAGHGRRHPVRRRAHASSRPARSARRTCTATWRTWSSSAPAPSPASACRWC